MGIVQMKVDMKPAEGLDHWSSPTTARKHSYFPATPILAGDLRAPQSVSTLRTVKAGHIRDAPGSSERMEHPLLVG